MSQSEPPDSSSCPLCGAGATDEYLRDRLRCYRHCGRCRLVFVPAWQHLSRPEEKSVYDLHRNHPADAGYRRFLERLYRPMRERLSTGAQGLDFGCGPGPTLSVMFEESGHEVRLYDPFYAPDRSVFDCRFDFITATEVVEHLRAPGAELRRLFGLLKPGAWLGIMTQMVRNRDAFSSWRYKDDPTHISFFSRASFQWLADRLDASIEFVGRDVVLLRKRPVTGRIQPGPTASDQA